MYALKDMATICLDNDVPIPSEVKPLYNWMQNQHQ